MKIIEEKIIISERNNNPTTGLFIKKVLKSEKNLGGRPVIIFVPGGPGGNHAVYLPMAENLLKYADLIFFDPRGCGNSDASDKVYCSIDHYIDDIESIRSYFNFKKIILLGGSYGAMASLGYAIRYPCHLEKLILLAGAPSYKFIESAKKNLERRGTDEQKEAANKLWEGKFRDAIEFSDFYKIMAPLYSTVLDDNPPTTSSGTPYNIEVLNFGFKKFLREFNFESDLSKVQCETLLICGKGDWINDPSHTELMASNIQGSILHLFDNCGHFAEVDQPEKFYNVINDFLSRKDH